MDPSSWFKGSGRGRVAAVCLCLALAQGALWADGVTRSVEPVAGGCKVTLVWEFSGKIESDLIIEERLAQGWTVNDSTVPFVSLDASWFSGHVARFAVKPALLAKPGAISFTVVSGGENASGTVAGDWKMYLGGALRKGTISGTNALSAGATDSDLGNAATDAQIVERTIAISSFKVVDGVFSELTFAGIPQAGTLVVEGCVGFGKPWTEIARVAVVAGSGKVCLEPAEVGRNAFMRLKLLTEEK